jgi:hypothetical protein
MIHAAKRGREMPGVAYQGVVGDEGYFNFDGIPVLAPSCNTISCQNAVTPLSSAQ